MKADIKHEIEIMTTLMSFRHDPLRAVLYAFPWGRENTMFSGMKGPRDWQAEELFLFGEHIKHQEELHRGAQPLSVYKAAFSSGRGPGKTALASMLAWYCMSVRLGAPVIISANTEGQMRSKTFPELNMWFSAAINSHWFTRETMRIIPQPWLNQLIARPPTDGGLGIDPSYWYVQGQTWNADDPNAFAGAHNQYGLTVIFDEAAGIPSPIWDVTEGFFTEVNPYRSWWAFSQMRNRRERFFEVFHDEAQCQGWRSRTLTTRGMPGVDQGVIADQIRRYGEGSDFVRVEIDGLAPNTSESQFIPTESFLEAQINDLQTAPDEPLILGIDPAPRGRTCWHFRAGRNARDICDKDTMGEWYGLDNVELADKIVQLDKIYKPDCIAIDFGMGTGVIDILKRKLPLPSIVRDVRFGMVAGKDSEFATNGTRLWHEVGQWLPGGMIPKDDGTKGTLTYEGTNRYWKWQGREDAKKILESKQELKKRGVESPDRMDALACTFEYPNPPRRRTKEGHEVRYATGTNDYEFTI